MGLAIQDRMRFDRNTPWNPVPSLQNDTQDLDEIVNKGRPVFCCAGCLHPITDRAASLDMGGGHIHVFTNPNGFTYELALYSYADCVAYGEATMEYTWFSGYAWRLALCANCHEHLGWCYLKAGSASFYGLIRDRLIEANI